MQQAEQPTEAKTQLELIARLGEQKIDKNNPFKEDLLKRKPYAEILTNVLSIYTQGAVIALNGKWGTGKTTFVQKWQAMLENNGFQTIYFNAWQADYLEDPLVQLIANLQNVRKIDSKDNLKFESLMKAGAKLAIAGTVGFGKAMIKLSGGHLIIETLSSVANECGDLLKKKVDGVTTQASGIEQFKEELKNYINWIDSKNAIVYFIDELDRCNPAYAVRVLERIKHLFDIKRIIFILSIDKEQLENSIKGYFGSDIDAEDYLHRFIDIGYNLPQPDLRDFCDYLYKEHNLHSFFNNKREKHYGTGGKLFLDTAVFICTCNQITLRQLDRIFALAALTLNEFPFEQDVFPDLFFFLVYLKICIPSLFDKINDKQLPIQELIQEIENNISSQILLNVYSVQDYNASDYNKTIAKLLVTYVRNEFGKDESLILTNPDRLSFSVSKLESDQLRKNINDFENSNQGKICQIKFITDKINLLDSFKSNPI